MDRATTRYLGGWALAALATLAALLLSSDLSTFDTRTFLAMVLAVAAAEYLVVHIDLGRAGAVFTLSEAAIAAGLLLVPSLHVVLATSLAMALAHLPRRLSSDKVLFNVSQVTTATAVAGIVMLATPDLGPQVGERALATLVLAMAAYAAINTFAFRGLVARIAGRDGVRDFDDRAPLTLACLFGTVAVGVVAAALWPTNPWLIVLLLVPVFAIQLAARSSLAAASLVSTLRGERDRLDQVVQGASDGILLMDADGTVRLWSPALTSLTGIAAEHAIGRAAAELLDGEVREAPLPVTAPLADAAGRGPRNHRYQGRWRSSVGETRDIQEDHALLFDDRGDCAGDVVLVRDVTREAELERLRGDFVAQVSHELRTPLTPIRGYIQLLMRREQRMTEQQRTEALESMLERTDHLSGLVEDLLLVTQVERGDLDGLLEPAVVEVDAVLQRVVDDLAARFPGRHLEVRGGSGLPPVAADPDRLRQAVTAVADNALRYGEVDPPPSLVARAEEDGVVIEVSDHGPGVPASQQDRIFDRFQRLEDPLTMRTSGVGLGLFIARRLTEAMGGRLELVKPSGPTTFAFHLPRAAVSSRTPDRGEAAGPRRPAST